MKTEDKAKILLQHGDYTKYIMHRLVEHKITTPDIVSMITETFDNIIDPSDVKEELLEKEDNDVSEDMLDECVFDTWDEAWDFYQEECIASVSKSVLDLIGLSENDAEIYAHLSEKLLEIAQQEP